MAGLLQTMCSGTGWKRNELREGPEGEGVFTKRTKTLRIRQ